MNLYAANHDPNVFDYPEEFRPERWMNGHLGRTDIPGPVGDKMGVPFLTFGAGRRSCPGFESMVFCFFLNRGIEPKVLTRFFPSGQPRSLLYACASYSLFPMGASSLGRGSEERGVPALPC
jgi:hypothetical protein